MIIKIPYLIISTPVLFCGHPADMALIEGGPFSPGMSMAVRTEDEGREIARDAYSAAIRLTEDSETLVELEAQLDRDERLESRDRAYLRSLVEFRIHFE